MEYHYSFMPNFNWIYSSTATEVEAPGGTSWCKGLTANYMFTSTCCMLKCFEEALISCHYNDVIMGTMVSQITGVSIVCSVVCSGSDQRKHQSSASMAFVRGFHRGPVDPSHKGSVTLKMFPFYDVIMLFHTPSSSTAVYVTVCWSIYFSRCSEDVITYPCSKLDVGLGNLWE